MNFKDLIKFLILFLCLSCSSGQYHQVYKTGGEGRSKEDTGDLDSRKKDAKAEEPLGENDGNSSSEDEETNNRDSDDDDKKNENDPPREEEDTNNEEQPDDDDSDDQEMPPDDTGEVETNSQVEFIDSSGAYACGDSTGRGNFTIDVPDTVEKGDLLVFFLHRTDAPFYPDADAISRGGLPLVGGPDMTWNKEVSCYMQVNGKPCTENWRHKDLIQSVYWKVFDEGDQMSYTIKMQAHDKDHITPEWASLAVLRNVDPIEPIYGTATRSPDDSRRSVFPAVKVVERGYLLLSQSFDDAVAKNIFQAPDQTESLDYVTGDEKEYGCKNDETGFLFGRETDTTNEGKEYTTNGDGVSTNKDIMISISFKPKN
ncbi:MAG: hypothetical protein AB8G05_06845 [Oligoflexales bacterium]